MAKEASIKYCDNLAPPTQFKCVHAVSDMPDQLWKLPVFIGLFGILHLDMIRYRESQN